MKTYHHTPEQKLLAEKIFELDLNNLYYIVSQPDIRFQNHTINEIKKHIKDALKNYTRELFCHQYFTGAENKLFKYIAFIEYPKDFYLALIDENADLTSQYKGVHFHLFISSTKPSIVNMESVTCRILFQLTRQKLKERSIRKFSCQRIYDLSKEFAEYHTKQHYKYIDKERIMINL
jgi:hypothetical protein